MRAAAALLICGLASAEAATLPSERDASANWRKAGLLSLGGIPNRTTTCATVTPRESDQDDTSSIHRSYTTIGDTTDGDRVPAGTVVSVTSVNQLVADYSHPAAHVEAPTPNTIMRLRPRKGP